MSYETWTPPVSWRPRARNLAPALSGSSKSYSWGMGSQQGNPLPVTSGETPSAAVKPQGQLATQQDVEANAALNSGAAAPQADLGKTAFYLVVGYFLLRGMGIAR